MIILPKRRYDSKDDAAAIMRRLDELKPVRGNWETQWQEIADRVMPRQAEFTVRRAEGEKRTEYIFDSTAPLALDRFAAAMESMLTPRTSKWHFLKTTDEDLNENDQVSEWLDEVNTILWDQRYRPKANFANNAHETYMSLGAFGTGSIRSELTPAGMSYASVFLGEIYISLDPQGMVDTLYREFEWTARQAVKKWGLETVPEAVRNAYTKTPERKFRFVHCVMPRSEARYGRLDPSGMPYASYYISADQRQMIGQGGFWTFPYAVSRYVTSPRETYGRSPAMLVLADTKMVNEMSRTQIKVANRTMDPPLLLHDDGVLQSLSTKPGARNFGGVDEQGRQLVHPMQFGNNWEMGKEEMAERRQTINAAFLVTLFQILVETPQMTATEAMLRAQEKGALLAPTVGRQQSELLGPLIERELDLLGRAGALPPVPQVMIDAGAELKIEYESPMTRAMKAEEAAGFYRTVEAVMPVAQVKPEVLDTFDWEKATRGIARINGVPEDWILSEEDLAALQQGKATAAQAQQLLQAAPVVTDAMKNVADIQQQQRQARF